MAYTRCVTGPAIGPVGRGHRHEVQCTGSGPLQRGVPYHTHRVGIGWIPANPPKSGPPGPLVTYGLGQEDGRAGILASLSQKMAAAILVSPLTDDGALTLIERTVGMLRIGGTALTPAERTTVISMLPEYGIKQSIVDRALAKRARTPVWPIALGLVGGVLALHWLVSPKKAKLRRIRGR